MCSPDIATFRDGWHHLPMDAGHRRTRRAGIAALVSWITACGGDDRVSIARANAGDDPVVEAGERSTGPADGVLIGGGQTSDFGDGLGSSCDYVVETISRESARAQGWPVDDDLALLAPLVSVELQHERSSCRAEPEAAGTLTLRIELVGIRLGRGTPIPEAVGRVECNEQLRYAVDIHLDASEGWITGLFHAELDSDAGRLYGLVVEEAAALRGRFALHVDRTRPHLAQAHLSLEFSGATVQGELDALVFYTDQREPLTDSGERLLWPPRTEAPCTNEPTDPDGSGAQWLTLDAYRGSTPAP